MPSPGIPHLSALITGATATPDSTTTPSRLPPPPNRRSAAVATSSVIGPKGGGGTPKTPLRTLWWGFKLGLLSRKNSTDLTVESVEEHNRKLDAAVRKKKAENPYYYGLTDSTLYFSKAKQGNGWMSPGRESHATAATMGSISTVVLIIQKGVSSCFKGNNKSTSSTSTKSNFKVKTSTAGSSFSCSLSSNQIEMKDHNVYRQKHRLQHHQEYSEDYRHDFCNSSFQERPLREKEIKVATATSTATCSSAGGSGSDGNSSVVALQPVMVAKCLQVGYKSSTKEAAAMATTPAKKNGSDSRFVWADKYRPMALKDFICNREKAEQLHAMVKNGQCAHYIFEGLPGVGKKTMILAFLREAFGNKLMTWEECKEFELKGEHILSVRANMTRSPKHVEINLSELNGYEKHIIVALIKEPHNPISIEPANCDHTNCFAIIIREADKLSTDAQFYIKWLMERNNSCNRIFFCCQDATKLQHIRSLCTFVQLLPPSNKEIVEVLEFIAKKEGIQLPSELAERIAENSKHNLRQAIRSFEASWQSNYPFKEDQEIMTGWEEDTANIARDIIQEQSPKQLFIIRGKLQNLIEHNVSPLFTFRTLVTELKKHLSDEFQSKINALFQEFTKDCEDINEKSIVPYESAHEDYIVKRHNELRRNVQYFMRIEEFTAKFMSFYKSQTMEHGGSPFTYLS